MWALLLSPLFWCPLLTGVLTWAGYQWALIRRSEAKAVRTGSACRRMTDFEMKVYALKRRLR